MTASTLFSIMNTVALLGWLPLVFAPRWRWSVPAARCLVCFFCLSYAVVLGLHWGEGEVMVSPTAVALQGRLSPGPDYQLYLSPVFVQTEAEFEREKPRMARVGDVKTFQDFVVVLPPGTDVAAYTTVVVWCETFREFISAARYR
jgi:hypothetical protein